MSVPDLVDDSNHRVQYHAGWNWDPDAPGYVDNTRHSSAVEGNTASLGFSGTGIQVFGTLEPSFTSGQPSTAYTIDNFWHGTYTAPYTGNTQFNVTFFSKLDLPPGNHQISVVNTNGTSPNTIWLDYFLVFSDPSSSPDPSPTSGPATSSQFTVVTLPATHDVPSVSNSITTSLPSITVLDPPSSTSVVDSTIITTNTTPPSSTGLSNASRTSSQPPSLLSANTASQPTPPISTSILPSSLQSASTSSSPTTSVAVAKLTTNHVGIIIGTVLGAVVLVFVAIMLALIVRNRRHWSGDSISPFISDGGLCTSTTALAETATIVHVREKVEEVSLSTSSSPVPPPSSSSGSVTALSLPAPHAPLHDGESTRVTDKEPLHAEVATAPWYTASATQSRARAILQVFAIRGRGGRGVILERDVDSGLRRYDQPALPPPYTAE